MASRRKEGDQPGGRKAGIEWGEGSERKLWSGRGGKNAVVGGEDEAWQWAKEALMGVLSPKGREDHQSPPCALPHSPLCQGARLRQTSATWGFHGNRREQQGSTGQQKAEIPVGEEAAGLIRSPWAPGVQNLTTPFLRQLAVAKGGRERGEASVPKASAPRTRSGEQFREPQHHYRSKSESILFWQLLSPQLRRKAGTIPMLVSPAAPTATG